MIGSQNLYENDFQLIRWILDTTIRFLHFSRKLSDFTSQCAPWVLFLKYSDLMMTKFRPNCVPSVLNRNRVPEIAQYLVENRKSYIVSALTASVDASVSFEPFAESGAASSMGTLNVPMDATLLINDGQHRRAAIEEAIKENPELKSDNVPVLFFIDKGSTQPANVC